LHTVALAYPALVKHFDYVSKLVGADGLLRVEDLGVPNVWMDHVAFPTQRQKQCAFNLLAAGVFKRDLADIAAAMGDRVTAASAIDLAASLESAVVARFWSEKHGVFINNLPWVDDGEVPACDDQSLAFSILFDQCPEGRSGRAVEALLDEAAVVEIEDDCLGVTTRAAESVELPPNVERIVNRSYATNWYWRYRALAHAGHGGRIIDEFKNRWAGMRSVVENKTISEIFNPRPDSFDNWCHVTVAVPLCSLIGDVIGLRPLAPEYATFRLRPQFGDLADLSVDLHLPAGAMGLRLSTGPDGRTLRVELPVGAEGEIWFDEPRPDASSPLGADAATGLHRYELRADQPNEFRLP
jgi:alpha-L-rhamnosidase